jgi:hypothetical protein
MRIRIRIFPSRIQSQKDSGSRIWIRIRIKEFKFFNPKIVSKPRKYDPGCSSLIRILNFYPSRIPDPQHCPYTCLFFPDPDSDVSQTIYYISKAFTVFFSINVKSPLFFPMTDLASSRRVVLNTPSKGESVSGSSEIFRKHAQSVLGSSKIPF